MTVESWPMALDDLGDDKRGTGYDGVYCPTTHPTSGRQALAPGRPCRGPGIEVTLRMQQRPAGIGRDQQRPGMLQSVALNPAAF